ncbi:hypothetical protein RSAG8_12703, partial [Rhizoctonia solani AG-8 WAC10335]
MPHILILAPHKMWFSIHTHPGSNESTFQALRCIYPSITSYPLQGSSAKKDLLCSSYVELVTYGNVLAARWHTNAR